MRRLFIVLILLVVVSGILVSYYSKSQKLSDLIQEDTYDRLRIVGDYPKRFSVDIEDYNERIRIIKLVENIQVQKVPFWKALNFRQYRSLITDSNSFTIYDSKYIAFIIGTKEKTFRIKETESFDELINILNQLW